MKNKIKKEHFARTSFLRYEKKLILFKFFINNEFIPYAYRNLFANKIALISIHFVSLRNYCVLSGRSRSLEWNYSVSRYQFKKLSNFGYLSGVKKSSW